MIRLDIKRAGVAGLAALTIAATGLLAGCGQGSNATHIVLIGPVDQVEALIAQYKLREPPVQSRVETLPDGRERVTLDRPKGLPVGELIDLGKTAAKTGVNFEFTSGTEWNSGAPGAEPAKPAPKNGPVP